MITTRMYTRLPDLKTLPPALRLRNNYKLQYIPFWTLVKQKGLRRSGAPQLGAASNRLSLSRESYIMPPMPPGIAGVSSSGSATTTSVVTMRLPMEAAFCSAERVTIAGSMMPAVTRSS